MISRRDKADLGLWTWLNHWQPTRPFLSGKTPHRTAQWSVWKPDRETMAGNGGPSLGVRALPPTLLCTIIPGGKQRFTALQTHTVGRGANEAWKWKGNLMTKELIEIVFWALDFSLWKAPANSFSEHRMVATLIITYGSSLSIGQVWKPLGGEFPCQPASLMKFRVPKTKEKIRPQRGRSCPSSLGPEVRWRSFLVPSSTSRVNDDLSSAQWWQEIWWDSSLVNSQGGF